MTLKCHEDLSKKIKNNQNSRRKKKYVRYEGITHGVAEVLCDHRESSFELKLEESKSVIAN